MPVTLTFRSLTGCRLSEERGIGFLEGHRELNAGAKFDRLRGANERAIRSRMDEWLDGANGPKSHFHNFKYDAHHRNCFVFKYNENRFYGFLCHPKDTEQWFQLCSICI